jgi:hypothetical protein
MWSSGCNKIENCRIRIRDPERKVFGSEIRHKHPRFATLPGVTSQVAVKDAGNKCKGCRKNVLQMVDGGHGELLSKYRQHVNNTGIYWHKKDSLMFM